MIPSNSKRARQIVPQDNALDTWTWVALGAIAVIVLFSTANAFLNVDFVTGDYMDETYFFHLTGEAARTYAQSNLQMTFPTEATNLEYQYGIKHGWPFHIQFDVSATLGTEWVRETLCPESRFPNGEIIIENQAQQMNLACDQIPGVQMTIDQSDAATWSVSIKGVAPQ